MDFHTLFHTNWWIFPANFSLTERPWSIPMARPGVPQVVTVPCQMMRMRMPVPSRGVPMVPILAAVWGSNVWNFCLSPGLTVDRECLADRCAVSTQVPGCVCAEKSTNIWRMVVLRKNPTGFSLAEGLFETWGRINIKCASIFFWEVERARFLMISPSLSLCLSFFLFLSFFSLSASRLFIW